MAFVVHQKKLGGSVARGRADSGASCCRSIQSSFPRSAWAGWAEWMQGRAVQGVNCKLLVTLTKFFWRGRELLLKWPDGAFYLCCCGGGNITVNAGGTDSFNKTKNHHYFT